MTISTYTTGVRAHFFTVQEPTCHFRPCTRRVRANCKSSLFISLKEKSDIMLFSVRRSQYFIDCSQSFIFPWDRRDIARLTVNGGHHDFKMWEGAGVGDYSSKESGGRGGNWGTVITSLQLAFTERVVPRWQPVRRAISRRSHGKIGDCEQSKYFISHTKSLIFNGRL